jgi:hypothetical protein
MVGWKWKTYLGLCETLANRNMFFHHSKRDSSRVLLTELRAEGAKSAIYSKKSF